MLIRTCEEGIKSLDLRLFFKSGKEVDCKILNARTKIGLSRGWGRSKFWSFCENVVTECPFFSTILSIISNYVVTCLLKPQPFATETGYNCFDCDVPYFMLHIRSVFSQFGTLVFMQELGFCI